MSRNVVLSIIPVTSFAIAAAALVGADLGSFITSIEKDQQRAAAQAVGNYRERGCPNTDAQPFRDTVYFTGRDTLNTFSDAGILIVEIRRNPDGTFNVTGKADAFSASQRKGLKSLEKKVPDYKATIQAPGCG